MPLCRLLLYFDPMARPPDSAIAQNLAVGGASFSHGDIRSVVETFYARVEKDPVLSVPFSTVTDWPHHIERLTHFWWARFGGEPYMEATYDPVGKHYAAGFNEAFLTRWLDLFREVLLETLPPEKGAVWNKVASRMGEALTMKNQMMKERFGAR